MENNPQNITTVKVSSANSQDNLTVDGKVNETKFGIENPAFNDRLDHQNDVKEETVIGFNEPKSMERLAPEKPYAGMNKEDLLYFSQTNFWIRLRYVVLAIMGLAWLGLLAAIIALTIVWPRCKKEPTTEWWQSSRIYSIYVPTFYDSDNDGIGDLKGIENKLDYIKDLHVSAIHLSALYESGVGNVDQGYEIVDHKAIWNNLGTLSDFDSLVNASHANGLKVIVDLVPGHTSTSHNWFVQSSNAVPEYENYYIWRDCAPPNLPNNWKSVYGGPAWTQAGTRNQCYLHQLSNSQAQLNLRIKKVRDSIEDIMDFWLNRGVDGFKVIHSTFLYVDNEYRDEPNANNGLKYDSLNHIYTRAQPEVYNLISEWRYKLDERYGQNSRKILMTDADENVAKLKEYYNYLGRNGSQVPMNFPFTKLADSCDGLCVTTNVRLWTQNTPTDCFPNWLTGTQDISRLKSRSPANSKAYNILKMTLPGISINYYGEEIGMVDGTNSNVDPTPLRRDKFRTPMQWDSRVLNNGFSNASNLYIPALSTNISVATSRSDLNAFKSVTKLKMDAFSLQFGTFEILPNLQQNLFGFLRRFNGKDSFLVVANFGRTQTTENLSNKHERIPSEANVVANIGQESSYPIDDDKDIKLKSVSIKPGEAIVFKWDYERSMKDKKDK
ncbi:DgyrCDS8156 [Dimorphilus gyrociliatus]|uniref:DgyrCDS8156 n=1 Tax=Dimorphilus gyrociliatus TaxID=2664684 RepID=A0A7I8VYG8_9ANNE|nr:DgyrCDS8156 [Dimorphilus gyrociliatus]